MATIGETYGFSEEYVENFRVKVLLNGLAIENAVVQIVSPSMGTFNSSTNSEGVSEEIYLNLSETLTITVEAVDEGLDSEEFSVPYVFDSSTTQFEANLFVAPFLGNAKNTHFIRWHDANYLFIQGGELGTKDESNVFTPYENSISCLFDYQENEVPNNYRLKRKIYKPPFFGSDAISLILNFTLDLQGDDEVNITVGIMNKYGSIVASGISLESVFCADFDDYYLDFIFPNSLSNENFFVIYNTDNEKVYYMSNEFRVAESSEIKRIPIISFRNPCDIFGFPYECLTDSIRNTMRLDLNLVDQQPELEIENYRSATNGRRRNLNVKTSKVVSVESYLFDDNANDAMLILSAHEDITINSKEYSVKTAFTIETNKQNALSKGLIELYDQEFSDIN